MTMLGKVLICASLLGGSALGALRDGGIDPANLGKGDWIYAMADATNRLGGHVSGVTNEASLMLFYRSQGIRYIIIKAGTSDALFNGCYATPQFTSALVNIAHAYGILIFGYNRSYGQDIPGEIAIADYVFNQGADGFVWDAESEWESSSPWIGNNGPTLAWQLCSTVRSHWPTKFLAHAPFPIISYHSTFPYKEFGYFSDAVMPQIYHSGWTGVKGTASGGINWSDVNWANWQRSLAGASSVIDGQTVFWTNSIKPLVLLENVYGGGGASPCEGGTGAQNYKDVMEFIDYASADPNCVTAGGYQGVNFWRTDLHGATQWSYIKAGTSGSVPGVVNHIVLDDPSAVTAGAWTVVRTFYNGAFYGNGSGADTNSFGTNYLTRPRGTGAAYVQFTPEIIVPGDYDVYQWHPYRADASASVPFTITSTGGPATVYANQQTNAGNWSLLGQFNFAPGMTGSIRITDAIAESGDVAIADGLKLVFVSPTLPPVIASQPQSRAAVLGGTAMFSVMASSQLPMTYQWRRDGLALNGQTSSNLFLADVQPGDFAAYTVQVGNAGGSTLSQAATLTLANESTILSSLLTSSNLTLQFTTEFGPTYTVEYKNSLDDATWQSLAPGVPGTGSPATVTDSGLTNRMRFYRIKVH